MGRYKLIPDGVIASQISPLQDLYEQYIGYKSDGYFVEIGAFDGWSWSNTACLIDAGWRGIMVEPNPEYFVKLIARYAGNPNLQLIEAAVGKRNHHKAKLFLGGSLSTTKHKTIRDYPNIQGLNFTGLDKKNFTYVMMVTMDYLLDTFDCPGRYDVLVIDVEGAEIDVLKGYDIERHKPTLAIIETHGEHPDERLNWKAVHIDKYLFEHGYEKIYGDIINSIYYCKPV